MGVADQNINALRQSRMENVRGEGQGEIEALGHFGCVGSEAKTTEHRVVARIANAQHNPLEPLGSIHRFENDAQHIVELEVFDQRVADVLYSCHQNNFGVGNFCGGAGLALDGRATGRTGWNHFRKYGFCADAAMGAVPGASSSRDGFGSGR